MAVVKMGARFVSCGDRDMPAALWAFAAPVGTLDPTLGSTGGVSAAVTLPTFVAAGLFILK